MIFEPYHFGKTLTSKSWRAILLPFLLSTLILGFVNIPIEAQSQFGYDRIYATFTTNPVQTIGLYALLSFGSAIILAGWVGISGLARYAYLLIWGSRTSIGTHMALEMYTFLYRVPLYGMVLILFAINAHIGAIAFLLATVLNWYIYVNSYAAIHGMPRRNMLLALIIPVLFAFALTILFIATFSFLLYSAYAVLLGIA